MAAGLLAPGVRLSPSHLAREIGISHIPVREAITQLKSEGLVIHHPHRGAFVRTMERQELIELIEMRTVLECHTARQAAKSIRAEQLLELDARWQDLRCLAEAFNVPPGTDLRDQLRDWLLGDLAFHMVLLRAAGNRHVLRVLNETRVMTQMFGYRTDHPGAWADPAGFAEKNLAVHQAVYDAVRQRDPKAARRAMIVHMRLARNNILSRFDWLHRQSEIERSLAEEFPDSMRDLVSGMQDGLSTESAPQGAMPGNSPVF